MIGLAVCACAVPLTVSLFGIQERRERTSFVAAIVAVLACAATGVGAVALGRVGLSGVLAGCGAVALCLAWMTRPVEVRMAGGKP